LRPAKTLITTCEKPGIGDSPYLWLLPHVSLREHFEANRAILDLLGDLFNSHSNPQQILELAPSNVVDFFVNEIRIPAIFAHARLHDLMENVTPHRRRADIDSPTNKALED